VRPGWGAAAEGEGDRGLEGGGSGGGDSGSDSSDSHSDSSTGGGRSKDSGFGSSTAAAAAAFPGYSGAMPRGLWGGRGRGTGMVRCAETAQYAATALAVIGTSGLRTLVMAQVVTGRCEWGLRAGAPGHPEAGITGSGPGSLFAPLPAGSSEALRIDNLTRAAAIGSGEASGVAGSVMAGSFAGTGCAGGGASTAVGGGAAEGVLPMEVGLAPPLHHSRRIDGLLDVPSSPGLGKEDGARGGEGVSFLPKGTGGLAEGSLRDQESM
ncbi:unnamed protein product, partial [Discosporangium mesarthrocarpum]